MSDESIFINRELSWLDFNRRVLALGKDKNVPLGERIKFLAIYGSNLDEFFMVRVGSLQERANLEQSKTKKEKRENKTNMTAAEQLAAIMPKTAQLQEECDKFYAKALENLAENGYHKVDFDHLTKEEEHLWKKYFQSELFPILSPQIVDNRHPFPFLRNKEIYLGVLLKEKHTQEQSLGIVPISSQMERLHFIKKDGAVQFALTEELVLHYASSIFGKDSMQEKCLFRVTRNADIDVKEGMMDHDIDYRDRAAPAPPQAGRCPFADHSRPRTGGGAAPVQPSGTDPQAGVLAKEPAGSELLLQAFRPHGGRGSPGTVLHPRAPHAAAAGL